MYLLDTNVVSELRKPRPHGAVLAWFIGLGQDAATLSAVTFGEIQTGIEKTRPQNPDKALELERWLDRIEAGWAALPIHGATYRLWSRLMIGRPPQLGNDAMIAATAIRHGLIVATRNVRDFANFEVPVFNPFDATLARSR